MPELSIAADAVQTNVITGDFAVIQYLNWNTTWWTLQKTGAQWQLRFGTPAPFDGSGRIGYLPAAPPATGTQTLANYLDDVRRLLHDQITGMVDTDAYWTTANLTKDINKALRQRDLWSNGSLAYRQGVALTINADTYTLTTLFSDVVVLDVINIWLVYGQTRRRLNNPTFTTLTSEPRYRALTTRRAPPEGWARRNNTIYIAPAPSQAYTTDWDLSVLSTTLVNDTDPDPLAFPYTEPVPYYAAYQACINARQWGNADQFLGLFIKSMRDIEGSRIGEMQAYYAKDRQHALR